MGSIDMSPAAKQKLKQGIQLDADGLPIPQRASSVQVDNEGLPIPQTSKKKDTTLSPSSGVKSNTTSQFEYPSLLQSAGGNINQSSSSTQTVKAAQENNAPSITKPFADVFASNNLLDKDIASTHSSSLSNFNSAQGGDLTQFNKQQNTIASGGIVPSFTEQYEAKKTEIKTNPDALKEYRVKREGEIDQQINKVHEQEAPAISYLDNGARLSDSGVAPDAASSALKTYKADLKKSIANAAIVAVPKSFLSTNQNFNVEDVGKKYLDVIGDPTIHDDIKVLNTTATDLNPKGDTNWGKLGDAFSEGSSQKELDAGQKEIESAKQLIKNRLFKEGSMVLSGYHADKAFEIEASNPEGVDALKQLIQKRSSAQDRLEQQTIQSQIDKSLTDPTIKQWYDAATQTLHYANEAENSEKYYPQAARQKLRQELNDTFFNIVRERDNLENVLDPNKKSPNPFNIVGSWFFGETPTDEQIKKLASQVGKPENEVRDIVNTSVKGFFASAPQGVRISGLLSGVSQGMDETLANSVMGLRRIFNTDDVEAKNRVTQGKVDAYGMAPRGNKLYDEKGDLNFNPYSVFNMAGRMTGQSSLYALPTLITGGLAEGLLAPELLTASTSVSKVAKIANAAPKTIEGLTTLGTGYISSYEPAYKEIASYTDNEDVRHGYARYVAMANAAPELMLSPADIVKKMGLGSLSKKALIESFVKDAEKSGIEETILQRTLKGVKSASEVLLAENTEEQTTNLFTNDADRRYLDKHLTASQLADQAIQTFISTSVGMLPMAAGAGIGGFNDQSNIRKQGLFEAGNSPEETLAAAKKQFEVGAINQDQFNKTASIVNKMAAIVSNLPKTNVHGEELSYDKKTALAAQQYRISLNNKLKEQASQENGIAAQIHILEADTKEAIAAQSDILTAPSVVQPPSEQSSVSVTLPQSNTSPNVIPLGSENSTQIKGDGITANEQNETSAAPVIEQNTANNNTIDGSHIQNQTLDELTTADNPTSNTVDDTPISINVKATYSGVTDAYSQGEKSESRGNALKDDPRHIEDDGNARKHHQSQVIIEDDEELANGNRKVTINIPIPDDFGRSGAARFEMVIPKDVNVSAEEVQGIAQEIKTESIVGDLTNRQVVEQTVQRINDLVKERKQNAPSTTTTNTTVQQNTGATQEQGTAGTQSAVQSNPDTVGQGATNAASPILNDNLSPINTTQNATTPSLQQEQKSNEQSSVVQHTGTGTQRQEASQHETDNSNRALGSTKEKVGKATSALRFRANKIRSEGFLPSSLKADLPEGTQQAGFGGKALDEAVARAFELVADAIDAGATLADSIDRGFAHLRDYYEKNAKSFDEKKLRDSFEQEVNDAMQEDNTVDSNDLSDEEKLKKTKSSVKRRFKKWKVSSKDKTIVQDVIDTHVSRSGVAALDASYERLQRDKAATDLSMDLLIQDVRSELGKDYLPFLVDIATDDNYDLETRNAIVQSLLWRQGLSNDIINNLKNIDKELATRSQDNFMIRRGLASRDELSDEQIDTIEGALGDDGKQMRDTSKAIEDALEDNSIPDEVQVQNENITVEEIEADIKESQPEPIKKKAEKKIDTEKYKARAQVTSEIMKQKNGGVSFLNNIIDEINKIAAKC